MGHLPVVLMLNAVTVSLVAFGVLALAAALLLVVGAARRRSRSHTVHPTRPPTAAPRTDEESPTMADDPHDGAPGVLAETPGRTNGTESADSPATSTRSRSNGRSRRRATAPTTTPAEPLATAPEPGAPAEPAAEPAATPAEPVAAATEPTVAPDPVTGAASVTAPGGPASVPGAAEPTGAEPATGAAEPAEVSASVPGRTRVRPDPAPEPEASPEPTPERKARGTRAAKTGMKAATPGEAASPATRSSRSRARTTAPEAHEAVPATPPTPPVPAGPAGGRFLAPRRGRVRALLEVLDVPGAVVRPRDDVAAVLTRFYSDAVRAHDAVHIVQLTDAARADVGVELHAAGHIVGDARPYRDLTAEAAPEGAAAGRGLHSLRRPRVDGLAVKALRGGSSAVLVVDTRRSRPAAVADAAAMLDGLGVAVRGVVVWKGRIPRA